MPIGAGWDSPGARLRTERFQRRREEVVGGLAPMLAEGLQSAATATDQSLTELASNQGMFNLERPTVGPPPRPTPPATLAPPSVTPTPPAVEPSPLQRLSGALEAEGRTAPEFLQFLSTFGEQQTGGPEFFERQASLGRVLESAGGLEPQPPDPSALITASRLDQPIAGRNLAEQRFLREHGQRRRGIPSAGTGVVDIPPTPPTPLEGLMGAIGAVRRFEEPLASFVGKSVLETFGIPGTDLNLTRIPGAEAVATEVSRPTNLVPIPILDPLIAQGIGLVVRVGARVTPQVLRNAVARAARRLGEATLPRAERVALDKFRREATETLAEQVAEPAARAVGEAATHPTLNVPVAASAADLPAGEGIVYSNLSPTSAEAAARGSGRVWTAAQPAEGFVKPQNIEGSGTIAFRVRADAEPIAASGRSTVYNAADLEPLSFIPEERVFPEEVLAPSGQTIAERRARGELELTEAVERRAEEATGRLAGVLAERRPVAGGAADQAEQIAAREAAAAPPGPPPQTATGGDLPGRGNEGAKQALALKEETLLRPGRVTQLPGIRQVTSGLNPSVTIDRNVLVSYNARQAVAATLETEFAATRRAVVQRLQAAWDAQPPLYRGPKNNAMKNTIKDWADNPDFYTGVSPELRAAARAYDAASDQILARTRGEFGVDINAFSSSKAGAFYLPTVQARETLDDALLKVSQGYTSSGVPTSSARAKARVYEGAYQRSVKNPGFQAETDLAELTGLHDRALATMGGNETFRLGAGGRSRLDVMQELHPELANRMIFLRQRLTNLRGQAGRLNEKTRVAIDEFLANPDGNLSDLADALDVTVTRGRLKGADVKAVNTEIRGVRQEIRNLRPAWESANLDPFVLNRSTFRYHEAEQSAAVDRILQTKLPMGEGLLQAIDEVRLTAFAADVSPLTIQGLLGFLSDPITGARSLPRILKTLFSPEELLRVAGREPELVARFTQSTGRPFGELGGEFVQRARGIERIPGGRQLNESLMSAVEMLRYNQWKNDTALLQRLNPGMTQAVADAEAANALSKIIPALNPAERGASRLQARLERTPVISTSFIGGPATVIKDATAGLAKLTASRSLSPAARWQALSGREQLAVLHLGSISGTVATAAVGSHILSGWSPEDAVKEVLNPNSPRFLSIALGPKRRIPVGGPLRSAIRAFVPQKVGDVKGVPVYVPFSGTPDWLKGKVTPALRAPFDLARNADYFGGKIATGSFPESMLRSLWFAANSALPLAIQEPSEAIRRGEIEPTDVGGIAERAAAQLAGVDLRETSATEELRLAYREEIGREWDGSEAARRVAENNPRLSALLEASDREQTQRGFEGAIRREEREEVLGQLAEGMRGLIEGVRTRDEEAGPRLRGEYSTFKAQAFAVSLRDALGVDFPEPDTELGRLVQQYYEVELERDPETFQPQFWAFDAERDAILEEIAKVDPRVAEALQTNFRLPEEFRDVEGQLQEVADLRNQLGDIPQFRGISVERKREIDAFLRRVRAIRDRIKDERGPDSPDIPTMEDAIERAGQALGHDSRFVLEARALASSSARQRLLNLDYVRFIVENADQLLYFYPELRTDAIRRVLAAQ